MLSINLKKYLASLIIVVAGIILLSGMTQAQSAPGNAPAGSTLEQRIAQRKQERQTNLDEKATKRVQDRCVRTQNKIRSISKSYTDSSDNRNNVYRKIDAKLWMTIGSLKLVNQDTFKLEQQRLELAKKVQAFDNGSAQMRQALGDAAAINCASDPNGFMALIETVRQYNAQIRESFKDIKNYVVDQIKPTLTDHANNLKLKTNTEG